MLVSLLTLVAAAGPYALDAIEAKAASTVTGATSGAAVAGAETMQRVSHLLDRLAAFVARVPDELELVHRYVYSVGWVCAVCVRGDYLCVVMQYIC